MKCPIDEDECEGACGPKNTSSCKKRCQAGKTWMDEILRKQNIRHGEAGWAFYNKCYCQPCVIAKREYKKKYAKPRKEKKPFVITHGIYNAWRQHKCTCDICMEHKKRYLKEKNKRQYARRVERKRLYGHRDGVRPM